MYSIYTCSHNKLQSKEHCNKTFISPCNRYIGMSLIAHCNGISISNPKVEIGRQYYRSDVIFKQGLTSGHWPKSVEINLQSFSKKDRSLKGIYGYSSQTPTGKLNCIPKLHKCINKYSSRLVVWEQNLNFIKPEFSSLNIPFLSSFFLHHMQGFLNYQTFFKTILNLF